MSRYAANTAVSADKSRAEIETILRRYGAVGFAYGWDCDRAMIGFEADGRRVQFVLPMPDRGQFATTPVRGTRRSAADVEALWEQACRQSWRALALVIKAKLEAVQSGITCFEDEFLAHIVMPNGRTVGQWLRPQLEQAYQAKQMPPLLAAM